MSIVPIHRRTTNVAATTARVRAHAPTFDGAEAGPVQRLPILVRLPDLNVEEHESIHARHVLPVGPRWAAGGEVIETDSAPLDSPAAADVAPRTDRPRRANGPHRSAASPRSAAPARSPRPHHTAIPNVAPQSEALRNLATQVSGSRRTASASTREKQNLPQWLQPGFLLGVAAVIAVAASVIAMTRQPTSGPDESEPPGWKQTDPANSSAGGAPLRGQTAPADPAGRPAANPGSPQTPANPTAVPSPPGSHGPSAGIGNTTTPRGADAALSAGNLHFDAMAETPGTARLTGTVESPTLRAENERPGSGIY